MDGMYKDDCEEFGKKLLKLYNLRIFPRMGKIFADMLFQSGVEAGAYICSLDDVMDYGAKANLATQATVKLNEAAYILSVMKEAGYYTQEEIAELEEALDDLLQNVKGALGPGFGQPYRM